MVKERLLRIVSVARQVYPFADGVGFRAPAYGLPGSEYRSQAEGGVLDRRDVLDLMHRRSRMTIDPRTSTMPGDSISGFHRPGR